MPSTDRRIRVWWLLTSSLLLVVTSRPALTQQSAAPAPAEIDRQVEVLLAHLNGRWRWRWWRWGRGRRGRYCDRHARHRAIGSTRTGGRNRISARVLWCHGLRTTGLHLPDPGLQVQVSGVLRSPTESERLPTFDGAGFGRQCDRGGGLIIGKT